MDGDFAMSAANVELVCGPQPVDWNGDMESRGGLIESFAMASSLSHATCEAKRELQRIAAELGANMVVHYGTESVGEPGSVEVKAYGTAVLATPHGQAAYNSRQLAASTN